MTKTSTSKRRNNVKTRYGIYDLKDNERLVGVFGSYEAAEFLGKNIKAFYCNVTRGGKVHGRYKVYKL